MQQEMSVFKNDGYSEVFYFDYAADCPAVKMPGAIIGKSRVNITWTDAGAPEYTVEYRKKGSGTFSGEGYVGIPYLNNARVAVTFSNIVVNTDLQLISGYVETKFDPVSSSLLMDVDKTLTGGQGVGDIRSGEERAAFEVTYVLNPGIQVKPLVTDDSRDDIKDGGGGAFVRGENGKYRLVFTDDEGNEHVQETDAFPFTVMDRSGDTFEVNEAGDITLQGESATAEKSEKTENEEDKSTSHSDRGDFLYVTINGGTDTLMNGHTLTLMKQDLPVQLKVGCFNEALYHRAFLSMDSSKMGNVYAKSNWADSIRLNRTKWVTPSKNASGSIFTVDRETGSFVLKINAGDAVPVLLNDSTDNIPMLIPGENIKGHEISVSINISDGGILNFKPNNENYHERYGFDDALTMACQQSGDYEELEIGGTKYYVPWLGMSPNVEAEIKLVYTSDKKINMEGYKIVLESGDNSLIIDGESNKEYNLFDSIKVKVRATNSGSYYINTYLQNTSEINRL
jgi:hypothetical protein